MAIYKTGGKKYYKYQNWTQPVLTSDSMSVSEGKIVTTANSYYNDNTRPYKIMLGAVSSTTDLNYWQLNNTTAESWLQIKFPYKLRITGLSVYSRPKDNQTGTVTAYTNSSKTTKIGNTVTVSNVLTKYTFLSGGSGIETDTIYLHVTGQANYFGLQNLQITAQKVVDGTSSDYSYYIVENSKIEEIYRGGKRIVAVYKGSKLVYNLKYNLNSSSAYAKEGVVSGSDMFGADRGMAGTQSLNQTSIFTFNTPAPSGKYTGSFIYYSQVNFTMSQVYWRLTYEDGTQEYAYGPTGLGDTAYGGGETATVSLSFTAKKPIKAVTVYANGAGGGSGRYGGLGSIQLFFDGSKQ
jgi:hypothetical protein